MIIKKKVKPMNTNFCFEPIVDKNSKILILGSFPSVKSREVNFYYGNPQNRFWKVMEEFFKITIGNDIESKKQFLKNYHIALWDIVNATQIKGSSDLDLVKEEKQINEVEELLKKYPNIQKVFCNGKASYDLTVKYFPNIDVNYLPSTSPANVSFKKEIWFENLKILKK